MPDVPKHAWTHRPKAQGGTDPIVFPSIKVASASSGMRSRSLTSGTFSVMDFDFLWSNDASFGYLDTHGTSPKRANYIEISDPGLYLVKGTTYNDPTTPFSGSDNPIVEILVFSPSDSSVDLLINSKSEAGWDDGQSPIYGEMLVASEYAHEQMVQTVWFNFDPADFAEDTIGLGVALRNQTTQSRTIGGVILVARIADLMTDTAVT